MGRTGQGACRSVGVAALAVLAGLSGCEGGKGEDSGPEVCVPAAASEARLDDRAGYRVADVPVDAPWLEEVEGEARAVPLGIWYATDAAEGEHPYYLGVFEDTGSWVDAPFADRACGAKMPLIVYSHGSQGWGGNGSSLVRHLVAQGWVAAAPDHLKNTLLDNEEPRRVSFSLTRMADVIAAIDAVEALPEGDPLHGRVDTSKVLVMGHSFGGQTAWLLSGPALDQAELAARCEAEPGCTEAEYAAFADPPLDPRIAAVVPLDGFAGEDVVAPEGWGEASLPIFYMSQGGEGSDYAFDTAAAAAPTWAAFEGACHETFTDTPLPCDFDKEEGHDLIAAYLTAFAEVQIRGSGEARWGELLSGAVSLDPRVTIHTY